MTLLKRTWLLLTIALIALCETVAAQPLKTADEAAVDRFLQTNTNERGQHCTSQGRRRSGDRLLIACGRAGIWELAMEPAAPRFIRSYDVDGDAVGFFEEADGRVWVKVESLRAQPLDSVLAQAAAPVSTTAPPPPPAPPPPAVPSTLVAPPPEPVSSPPPVRPLQPQPPPREREGRVIAVGDGEVTISLGTIHGIRRGMRIEMSVERQEVLAGGESVVSREPIAIGVVSRASENFSRVELGLNEMVPLNALAERTLSSPTSSLSAPPRAGDVWELRLMGRPFVALDEFGGGILATASIGRRFESSWHVAAELDPFAIADARDRDGIKRSTVVAASALIIGAYDSKFLEMGLGLGGQTVNSPSLFVNPGSGIAIAQIVRLGTLDGLNLSGRSSIVLFHSEFSFAALAITGQIPIARHYWLVLGGGGGDTGYAYGELGLRVLLRGNGGPGSAFLTATAGGAGVFKEQTCDANFECVDSNDYFGPMAGVGGEWRF